MIEASSLTSESKPCPACGYDLRAAVGGLCPECGGTYAVHELTKHVVPWMINTSDQYTLWSRGLDTIRLVARRPWKLWDEAIQPIDDRPGRAFLAWATWPLLLLAATISWRLLESMKLTYGTDLSRDTRAFRTGYEYDLFVPLMLAPRPWTAALVAAIFFWLWPRGSAVIFGLIREGGAPTERALRAAALSRYASVGMWIISTGLAIAVLGGKGDDPTWAWGLMQNQAGRAVLILGELVMLWGVAILGGVPLLLMRKAGASWLLVLVGALITLLYWTWTAVTALFFGAWIPGYLRITSAILTT